MSYADEQIQIEGKKRRAVGPLIAVAIVIALIVVAVVLRVGPEAILLEKKTKLQNELDQVQTGEVNFYTEYSVYPVASDNATLIRKLVSDNPRHIAFLSVKESDENAKGELLDPWGTPFRLSVTDDGKLRVSSAGPDKVFGTPDDNAGEFATDDFVVMKPPTISK